MTESEYIYICINAILYVSWIFLYYRKVRCFNVGMLLLSIWTVSAVFSLLYEPVNFIGHYHKIVLLPFFFIFVLNLIAFNPVLNFRHEKLKGIKANSHWLVWLGYVIGCISLLPFIENFIYFLGHFSDSGLQQLSENMADRYEDASITYAYLSRPALICTRLLGFIGINLLSLLLVSFPLFCSVKKNKFAYIGICLANLSFVLQAYNIFARFRIAVLLVLILANLLIFYNYYSKPLKKKIVKYSIVGFFSILFVFGSITVTRMATRNERSVETITMPMYIGQYLCEAMPNFASDRYLTTDYGHAEAIEAAVRRVILRQDPSEYSKPLKTGNTIGPQFTTYIGDFYISLGPFWIFVVFISASIIFNLIFRNRLSKGVCSLATIYLFIAYLRIFIMGICYDTYAVGSDEFVFELFIIPLMLLFERNNKMISKA